MSAPYARDHDGRLPFAPVCDLEDLRCDVAVSCTILMEDLHDYMTGEYREGRIAEAVALARYFDDLLTAAIFRRAAADERLAAARVAS